MDVSTRNWVVQTIAGFVLLVVWIASILTPPIVVLQGAVQAAVLALAVAALGLQTLSSLTAVKTAERTRLQRGDKKNL